MESDKVIHILVSQSRLENFQRLRLHNLTRQPSPQFDCPHTEIFFPLYSMNFLFQFVFTASRPFQAWKEQMEH